jgi:hypothetical protein
MRKIVIIVTIFFGTSILYAQPTIAWQTCFSTTGDDFFSDAIITQYGQIAAVAKFAGYDGFMENQDSLPYPASLMMFDAGANLLWTKNFGGVESVGFTSTTIFHKITEIPDFGFVIGGVTSANDGDFPEGHGLADIAVMKTDYAGNKIWSKAIGGTGNEEFEAILPTMDGGVLITGRTYSSNGDIPFHYGSGFTSDAIVIKLDNLGNTIWLKVLGGTGNEGGIANIAEIRRGVYYFHISTNSNDYDLATSPILGGKRWMLKMDSLGNIVEENIISAVTDLYTSSNESFVIENNKFLYASVGNPESLLYPAEAGHAAVEGAIAIFDTLLQMITFKQWGGSGVDNFKRILIDENGDYILLGFSSSKDYDLPGNYNNGENNDFWLAKIDKNLNLIWSKNFGGSYPNGDDGGGQFFGNMVLNNNKLYCFLQVVVPDVLPDYDITCGVSEGIAFFDAWLVAFDLPTSTLDLVADKDIHIYPNPNTGSFTVESTLLKSSCAISLFTVDGKIAYKANIEPAYNQYFVNTQNLNAGFYYLVVTDGEQVMRSSIIIE